MKTLTVISPTEINTIKNAIDKIEEIRNDINSKNQDNRSKYELVTSILDIEEVLAAINVKLESVIEVNSTQ